MTPPSTPYVLFLCIILGLISIFTYGYLMNSLKETLK